MGWPLFPATPTAPLALSSPASRVQRFLRCPPPASSAGEASYRSQPFSFGDNPMPVSSAELRGPITDSLRECRTVAATLAYVADSIRARPAGRTGQTHRGG